MRLSARPQSRLRMLAWALLLLAGHALQVAAVTHWHGALPAAADVAAPQTPVPDLPGHDGCVLCQVAAHTGGSAPPPAPWILHIPHETRAATLRVDGSTFDVLRLSHAWQGRAPPRA